MHAQLIDREDITHNLDKIIQIDERAGCYKENISNLQTVTKQNFKIERLFDVHCGELKPMF